MTLVKGNSERRLLIVSPHFPPTNTADLHRVRTALPYFEENGWRVDVLAVCPNAVAAPIDPWLLDGIPKRIGVCRVRALSLNWSRLPGLGSLDLRARRAVRKAGDQLLRAKDYALIYFSTTMFGLFSLGVRWRKKFDVPYVLDYQDPWVTNYYKEHPHIRPPGGRLKYGVVQWFARRAEPKSVCACSGITTVSAAYVSELRERYPWTASIPACIEPFPAPLRDIERAASDLTPQCLFDPDDGNLHWVYVGCASPIMFRALKPLFQAIRELRRTSPAQFKRLRLHFVGTSYAPAGTAAPAVVPLAEECGIAEAVEENPDRVSYKETLRILRDASALIVPGSDDPAYVASKLYLYVLTRKPLLAILHELSPACSTIGEIGGAQLVTFGSGTSDADVEATITKNWLELRQFECATPVNEAFVAEVTDSRATERLCNFFEECLDWTSRNPMVKPRIARATSFELT